MPQERSQQDSSAPESLRGGEDLPTGERNRFPLVPGEAGGAWSHKTQTPPTPLALPLASPGFPLASLSPSNFPASLTRFQEAFQQQKSELCCQQ